GGACIDRAGPGLAPRRRRPPLPGADDHQRRDYVSARVRGPATVRRPDTLRRRRRAERINDHQGDFEMSVTTTHGRFAFICDMCGDVVETGESDFDTAVSGM